MSRIAIEDVDWLEQFTGRPRAKLRMADELVGHRTFAEAALVDDCSSQSTSSMQIRLIYENTSCSEVIARGPISAWERMDMGVHRHAGRSGLATRVHGRIVEAAGHQDNEHGTCSHEGT